MQRRTYIQSFICFFWLSDMHMNYSHMICCRLDLVNHASGQHFWRGQGDTSCRTSEGTAGVWALCCGSSACRWDRCPWARRCLAVSASPPRLANFPPRSPQWWQGRRSRHFQHFHPFCFFFSSFFSATSRPINTGLRLETKDSLFLFHRTADVHSTVIRFNITNVETSSFEVV